MNLRVRFSQPYATYCAKLFLGHTEPTYYFAIILHVVSKYNLRLLPVQRWQQARMVTAPVRWAGCYKRLLFNKAVSTVSDVNSAHRTRSLKIAASTRVERKGLQCLRWQVSIDGKVQLQP